MKATLTRTRDKLGQTTLLAPLMLLTVAATVSAASREYRAERFDVAITALPGGDLEVAEAVTFDFQSGTFEKVWREIPGRRADGIDIVEATMDDARFPIGDGPNHIVVNGIGRKRVEWRFRPVGASTHTFGLRYRVRGVAYTDERGDVIAWRALPTDHAYRIASTHLTLATPEAPVKTPIVERRRVGAATIGVNERVIDVRASEVARNGWIEIETVLPAHALVSKQPEWRANERAAGDRDQDAAFAGFVGSSAQNGGTHGGAAGDGGSGAG